MPTPDEQILNNINTKDCAHCGNAIRRIGSAWLHVNNKLLTCRPGKSNEHGGIYRAEPVEQVLDEQSEDELRELHASGCFYRTHNSECDCRYGPVIGLLAAERDTVKQIRAENQTLKEHWANTSEDLASALLKQDELQSQLEQLRAENEALRQRMTQMERDARDDAEAASNEARWQERQGDDYGSC